jgi:hypothetical protein
MHMWHHVTNHLITSNDKDSNSENRIKLRVRHKGHQTLSVSVYSRLSSTNVIISQRIVSIHESHQSAISQQQYLVSYQDPIQV